MNTPPILRGDLVTLRPIDPTQDAIQWFEVMQDDDMHRWTGNTVPTSVEEVVEMLIKYATLEEIISWAVVENGTKEMVGTYWITVPVLHGDRWTIHDEAQRFAKRSWRKGHAKEARRLVYDYAFGRLGVDEIHAHAWARNVASCRSMEHAGHRLVDAQLRHFTKRKKLFCERHYAITKEIWLEKTTHISKNK
jgi:[ribosomal protein S5]-alanine N-acetyltransferase